MKKLLLLGGIALSFILRPSSLSAQFTVGSNDGANTATAFPTPIFDYYKTSKTQYLYLASEMIAAGMTSGFIDELSWNVVAIPAGTGPTEGYTLKMKATNTTSLGLTTWEEGTSLVYGPADYTPVLGTNNFVLDDPFYWDGVSNLIVEVCGGDDNVDYTKNTRVSWTGTLDFNASRTHLPRSSAMRLTSSRSLLHGPSPLITRLNSSQSGSVYSQRLVSLFFFNLSSGIVNPSSQIFGTYMSI